MTNVTFRLLRGKGASLISRDARKLFRITGAHRASVCSYTNAAVRRGPPLVIHTVEAFRKWKSTCDASGRSLGFVPTMGALHDGHLSLVQQACEKCENVAVSIFVNPAQFAPHEDLNAYPRTVERDLEMLTQTKAVDVVFIPSVKELYPSGISLDVKEQKGTFVEVLGLGARMEGVVRPHFFRGVTTIVTKLLNITQPSHLFLGQKDFQQASIVRHLIHDLLIPTNLVVAATIREPVDGLAMSSRNRYLSPPERAVAGVLYKALSAGKNICLANGPRCGRDVIIEEAKNIIDEVVKKEADKDGVAMSLEYLSLVDPWTLEELVEVATASGQSGIFEAVGDGIHVQRGAVFSGAIRVGKTRLIDNVLIGCVL